LGAVHFISSAEEGIAPSIGELSRKAQIIRRHILKMVSRAGTGHISPPSVVDILTVLYFSKMRHKPEDPYWEDRDRFALCKGHAAPTLYAVFVEVAHREALLGNYWCAMTINGLIYSAALGYPCDVIVDCLEAGAIAAGLSGKGPAIVAVSSEECENGVKSALSCHGKVLVTETNKEGARFGSNKRR